MSCYTLEWDSALTRYTYYKLQSYKFLPVCFRYQMKLQSDEIQVHAEEMTNLRNELENETKKRKELEEYVKKLNHTLSLAPDKDIIEIFDSISHYNNVSRMRSCIVDPISQHLYSMHMN